eukprot:CAMPEP_0113923520 /NCGR_PEP_ID=MMETSP1159-20121227/2188_1 /TAXON_ID=88271 /ORGANISM="Picocystis salinarum" /LENGTH=55 /DNA_ID=CAMNT_0000923697 /DNA_START=618 /DNA_END=781 /DNA_ORIENTATION=- /assembly_acc=CAM_ASM_000767
MKSPTVPSASHTASPNWEMRFLHASSLRSSSGTHGGGGGIAVQMPLYAGGGGGGA